MRLLSWTVWQVVSRLQAQSQPNGHLQQQRLIQSGQTTPIEHNAWGDVMRGQTQWVQTLADHSLPLTPCFGSSSRTNKHNFYASLNIGVLSAISCDSDYTGTGQMYWESRTMESLFRAVQTLQDLEGAGRNDGNTLPKKLLECRLVPTLFRTSILTLSRNKRNLEEGNGLERSW
jgi:hypothetical protein